MEARTGGRSEPSKDGAAGSGDATDPAASAKAAGLRYVSDLAPGIRRRRAGKHFSYLAPDGSPVRDEATLRRIKSLAIPPAWSDVWICPEPRGHIQAVGRDAKGRKQYRYHPRWREARDAVKYDRLIAFGEALPRIRQRTDHDLGLPGLPREKVLATVVELLEDTSIRVGNEEYREQNQSFGLTTLRNRHARVEGSTIRFKFRGKSGKEHDVRVSDRRLARVVKRCQELPGQELFQYVDEDGERRAVESEDVNEYLREISGGDFTAKDFRTWNGTVLAARFLSVCEPYLSERQGKQQVATAIKQVAEQLGNTPAVCRKAYVHPAVIEAYEKGCLILKDGRPGSPYALSTEERAVLSLLRSMSEVAHDEVKRQPLRQAA